MFRGKGYSGAGGNYSKKERKAQGGKISMKKIYPGAGGQSLENRKYINGACIKRRTAGPYIKRYIFFQSNLTSFIFVLFRQDKIFVI